MLGHSPSHRLYLDHNATSPLCPAVLARLQEGVLPFANPASVHSSGKEARRALNEAVAHIKRHLDGVAAHQLVFHSGATEGVSMVLKGHALGLSERGLRGHYFLGAADHTCVLSHERFLKTLGHQVSAYPVSAQGTPVAEWLMDNVGKAQAPTFINYTVINNETGVHADLGLAARVKAATGAFVHVDAAQLPFKTRDWNVLLPELDAYTFSGHKFGALKGSGLTFVREDADLFPLIDGGGHQFGRRSGTENVMAALAFAWAMEEGLKSFDPGMALLARVEFERALLARFEGRVLIAGMESASRACNTVALIIPGMKAQLAFAAFDLAGIDVGAGSACSSGLFQPSRVLMAMGFKEDLARSMIRLSFGPTWRGAELMTAQARCLQVLNDLLK